MHPKRETLNQSAELLLRDLEQKELTIKERNQIPLQEMATQEPSERIFNMAEVALGYTEAQVRVEALRCLQCKTKPCIKGCPVGIDIPAFILETEKGNYAKAVGIIKESSLLPSVCGRVCPQELQCQMYCTVGKAKKDVEQSVSIGRIERFVADYTREHGLDEIPTVGKDSGKSVAIVGSGPASLSAAADLRREGHRVVIFEALHKAGGVLVYGIPEFRLPKEIVDHELDILLKMGVELKKNYLVGKTRTVDELFDKDGFDAIFIGSGAGLPRFLDIEGENSIGVFSANEYLTRSNLMKAYAKTNALTPMYRSKRVAVLGAGNVAMDAARTAKRLGAEVVSVIYRRTEEQMPARREEIAHAKEEGIEFLFLHAPKRIIPGEDGRVKEVEVVECKLGPEEEDGRRRSMMIEGTEHLREYDTVIVAIGNDSNPLIKATTEGIETSHKGTFIVDPSTCATSLEGVYAGGDIVLGAATVILAMGQGRKAAKAMNEYLSTL